MKLEKPFYPQDAVQNPSTELHEFDDLEDEDGEGDYYGDEFDDTDYLEDNDWDYDDYIEDETVVRA